MSGSGGKTDGGGVEKIMSLSTAEFHSSLSRLHRDAGDVPPANGRYNLPLDEGRVVVSAELMEPVLLGGLISLPRCRVHICFEDVPPGLRSAFLNRFDRAFQRGGG